jgi:hypothetical protein
MPTGIDPKVMQITKLTCSKPHADAMFKTHVCKISEVLLYSLNEYKSFLEAIQSLVMCIEEESDQHLERTIH